MKPSDHRQAALEFVETDELHVVEPRAAAMEGTGVYWLAPYEALKAAAIRPSLRHAQHVQQSKGRKTDKNDSLWLARICQFGRARNRRRKLEKYGFLAEEQQRARAPRTGIPAGSTSGPQGHRPQWAARAVRCRRQGAEPQRRALEPARRPHPCCIRIAKNIPVVRARESNLATGSISQQRIGTQE